MGSRPRSIIKFFLYLLGKIIAAAVALAVIAFAFFTALNTMNVNVAMKDAFAKRASVTLMPQDNDDFDLLEKLFTTEYLEKSGLAEAPEEVFYDVSNFIQRTDVSLTVIFPWTDKATITVKDVIEDVRATLINEDSANFEQKETLMDSGVYEVTIEKIDSEWLVSEIEQIEKITQESTFPLPTPEPKEESEEEQTEEEIEEIQETDDLEEEETEEE